MGRFEKREWPFGVLDANRGQDALQKLSGEHGQLFDTENEVRRECDNPAPPKPIVLTIDQINSICDFLEGTASHSLLQITNEVTGLALQDESEIANESLVEIDQRIFNCVTCGWWCSVDEESDSDGDGPCCVECAAEIKDE